VETLQGVAARWPSQVLPAIGILHDEMGKGITVLRPSRRRGPGGK